MVPNQSGEPSHYIHPYQADTLYILLSSETLSIVLKERLMQFEKILGESLPESEPATVTDQAESFPDDQPTPFLLFINELYRHHQEHQVGTFSSYDKPLLV